MAVAPLKGTGDSMSRLQRVVAEQNTTGPAFYRSSDLSLPFRVKIVGIEARLLCGQPVEELGTASWDLYVTCQIFSNGGKPLCLPEQTAHRPMVGRPVWNEVTQARKCVVSDLH